MQHPSISYVPLILLIFIILCLRIALKKSAKNLKGAALAGLSQYQKRKELFSAAERSFLGVLEQALSVEYRILGKVRLGDLIEPKRGISKKVFYTALNKVNQKHVDYVVCRKSDCKILGVVELDDSTHKRDDRMKRDQFVDKVLAETGIPILHFSAQMSYPINEVRASLVNAFSLWMDGETQIEKNEFSFQGTTKNPEPPSEGWTLGEAKDAVDQKEGNLAEYCPDCGSEMRVRKVSRGPHEGKFFFVCVDYPKCKTLKRVIDKVA